MPLYEYRCSHCESLFEVLQRMGEGPEGLTCPSCGRDRVTRELSTFASVGGESSSAGAGCAPRGGFT